MGSILLGIKRNDGGKDFAHVRPLTNHYVLVAVIRPYPIFGVSVQWKQPYKVGGASWWVMEGQKMVNKFGVWDWSVCISESSSAVGLERGLTRFPKTSSQVIRSPSASSGYFPSTPNSGDSVAFTGISEDLTDSSIPPESIQAGSWESSIHLQRGRSYAC